MWESTTESVVESKHAHHEHMLGIDRLVQCRGHGQAKSPLGEALMKNITYGAVRLDRSPYGMYTDAII